MLGSKVSRYLKQTAIGHSRAQRGGTCTVKHNYKRFSFQRTMATQKVYVVTGASRGLGLGFVDSLLREPATVVVAAARSPDKSEALQTLLKEHGRRLHTVALDSADDASVKARHSSKCQVDGAVYKGMWNAGVGCKQLRTVGGMDCFVQSCLEGAGAHECTLPAQLQ